MSEDNCSKCGGDRIMIHCEKGKEIYHKCQDCSFEFIPPTYEQLRAENEALLLIKDAAEDCLDKALDWVNSTDKEENETRELSPEFQRLKDLLICEGEKA